MFQIHEINNAVERVGDAVSRVVLNRNHRFGIQIGRRSLVSIVHRNRIAARRIKTDPGEIVCIPFLKDEILVFGFICATLSRPYLSENSGTVHFHTGFSVDYQERRSPGFGSGCRQKSHHPQSCFPDLPHQPRYTNYSMGSNWSVRKYVSRISLFLRANAGLAGAFCRKTRLIVMCQQVLDQKALVNHLVIFLALPYLGKSWPHLPRSWPGYRCNLF